jgi:succinoglycan biosynthesis transport protein ExoP
MNGIRHNEPPAAAGFGLVDVYFVLFRHKWKIIILTLLGLLMAGYYYHTKQPPYQSDAALLIRYVSDTHPLNPVANDSQVISMLDQQGLSVIKAEMEIMSSADLAALVASNIGPDKILAKVGGGSDPIAAANVVKDNLIVNGDGSVIHLTFSNPDPAIVQPVLSALVAAYQDKHDQIHHAPDLSDEALTEQTATLSQNIIDLDRQLRDAKAVAGVGIINVDDSQKFFSDEITRLRRELFEAQADLAEHQAIYNVEAGTKTEMVASNSATNNNIAASPPPALAPAPPDQLDKYKTASTRLSFAQQKLDGYLQQGFTDDNKLVKEVRDQIADATKIKSELETNYPVLAKMDLAVPDSTTGPDSTSGPANAAPAQARASTSDSTDYLKSNLEYISLPARIRTLQAQLAEIQSEADKLGGAEAKISDLERRKQLQEDSLKSFASALQEEGINEAVGPGRNSNIESIETPTTPYRNFKKFHKIFYGLLLSGLVAGLGWAFLIEFYLDHTIKRPIEIQNKLKIPFFLSIPDLNRHKRGWRLAANTRRQLAYKNGSSENGVAPAAKEGSLEVMAGEINRRFDSYYDALRDRLVVYFESVNLTRKPKLVAVTSTHKGAGVSTIASGLAASLSETGDGRVLLVDMNQEHGTVQQFFQGHANCKLDDALESEKRSEAMVQENLYVVTEDTVTNKLPRALPKRFASLIPKLKASDYDYIIFDMPPVSPTSVTARLAGFMDTVMLVIESEKTSQQVVLQANALLAQSKANVTVVLNKTRQYIPARLHKDFLYDV